MDKPDKFSIIFRAMSLMSFNFKPGEFETIIPDLFIDESFNFAPYGFEVNIMSALMMKPMFCKMQEQMLINIKTLNEK